MNNDLHNELAELVFKLVNIDTSFVRQMSIEDDKIILIVDDLKENEKQLLTLLLTDVDRTKYSSTVNRRESKIIISINK